MAKRIIDLFGRATYPKTKPKIVSDTVEIIKGSMVESEDGQLVWIQPARKYRRIEYDNGNVIEEYIKCQKNY